MKAETDPQAAKALFLEARAALVIDSQRPIAGTNPILALMYDNGFVEGYSARAAKDAERIAELEGALRTVNEMLTIPAAEYVPAIPDCWAVIARALTKQAPNEG